jgi:hypothetical protein
MYLSWSTFWRTNGWAGGKMMVPCAHPLHPETSTPHGWVSHIILCARTDGPNSQEKDMCHLESYGDRNGWSPWVLKAILFFKFFFGGPRAPCLCIMQSFYTHSLVVRRNEKERIDRKWLYVTSLEFTSWTKVNLWERVSHDVFKNLDRGLKKYTH